jgi:hypothetical protein
MGSRRKPQVRERPTPSLISRTGSSFSANSAKASIAKKWLFRRTGRIADVSQDTALCTHGLKINRECRASQSYSTTLGAAVGLKGQSRNGP